MNYQNHSYYSLNLAHQRGAILLSIIGIILIMGMLTALTVDLGRAEFAATKLQTAADAAALASTTQLNGTHNGWIAAKRAVFAALRANKIFGHDGSINTPDNFGTLSSDETDESDESDESELKDLTELELNYQNINYTIGNLNLNIQRGFYGSFDKGRTYKFISLEGIEGFFTDLIPVGINGEDCTLERCWDTDHDQTNDTCAHGCPVFEVANATQVQLTINTFKTIFAPIIPGGAESLKTIQQQAISAHQTFSD